jgi:SAF domain
MTLMSFLLGEAARRAEARDELLDQVSPPAATRASVDRLRDPRLWIGVFVVAVSALVGGRLLSAADDSSEVWAAARDLPAGAPISIDDLVATSVRFDDSDALRAYLPVASTLPGHELAEPIRAGELIPESAIGVGVATTSDVPLGVAAADLPADLAAGDVVDVWAVPGDGQERKAAVARVIAGVRVASVAAADLVGAGGEREVVLAVDSPSDVLAVLGGLADSRTVLVRVGG